MSWLKRPGVFPQIPEELCFGSNGVVVTGVLAVELRVRKQNRWETSFVLGD